MARRTYWCLAEKCGANIIPRVPKTVKLHGHLFSPEQDSVAPDKALVCEKRKDDVTDSARDACASERLHP